MNTLPQSNPLSYLVIFLIGLGLFKPSLAQEAKPNVIFIMCDDLNDYEGIFGGHPQAITPNIDKLAESGVQFLNAQSNCPVCMPSRNSLFTGVYPHDSKDFGWTPRKEQPVLKNNKTIMHLLKENGYYVAGTGKLLHKNEPEIWDEWGMKVKYNYGPFYFDGEDLSAHPGVPAPYNEIGPIDGSYGSMDDITSTGVWGQPGFVYGWDKKPLEYIDNDERDLVQDELHAEWAVQKLQEFEQNNLQKPFFLGIGFVKPHTPLIVPGKYFDMYPIEDLKIDDWLPGDKEDTYYLHNFSSELKGPRYYKTILESYNGDRKIAIKSFLQAYLACVSFVDEQIGKVIDGLENSKFANNTIVILTSDHGWQMGEKDYLFKNSGWEESARIPLVIKSPQGAIGKVEQPVSLIDIFPTLVDFCNLEGIYRLNIDGGVMGGYSLRPLIENPETETWDGPEGALTVIGNAGKNIPGDQQNYSYRTKNWRYIIYSDGSEELYNHETDPYEWYNLASNDEYNDIKYDLNRQVFEIIEKDNATSGSDLIESGDEFNILPNLFQDKFNIISSKLTKDI